MDLRTEETRVGGPLSMVHGLRQRRINCRCGNSPRGRVAQCRSELLPRRSSKSEGGCSRQKIACEQAPTKASPAPSGSTLVGGRPQLLCHRSAHELRYGLFAQEGGEFHASHKIIGNPDGQSGHDKTSGVAGVTGCSRIGARDLGPCPQKRGSFSPTWEMRAEQDAKHTSVVAMPQVQELMDNHKVLLPGRAPDQVTGKADSSADRARGPFAGHVQHMHLPGLRPQSGRPTVHPLAEQFHGCEPGLVLLFPSNAHPVSRAPMIRSARSIIFFPLTTLSSVL